MHWCIVSKPSTNRYGRKRSIAYGCIKPFCVSTFPHGTPANDLCLGTNSATTDSLQLLNYINVAVLLLRASPRVQSAKSMRPKPRSREICSHLIYILCEGPLQSTRTNVACQLKASNSGGSIVRQGNVS